MAEYIYMEHFCWLKGVTILKRLIWNIFVYGIDMPYITLPKRGNVRSYVRLVSQGGDHSEKVIYANDHHHHDDNDYHDIP